jgi:hypothetical protein
VPKLKPRRAEKPRKSAERLEQAIKERMPERSLLGIVARTAYWIEWWHRFGPASGNDPKLKDPFGRYVITTFVKGTNMAFAEAARHIAGVSAHELSVAARGRDRVSPHLGSVHRAVHALRALRGVGGGLYHRGLAEERFRGPAGHDPRRYARAGLYMDKSR